MAENYAVCPIDDEVIKSLIPDLSPSPAFTHSKLTKEVVLESIHEIPNLKVEENDAQHMSLETNESLYTELSLLNPNHPMETVSVGFRGGHIELIEIIMKNMSRKVGPLLLYFGSGENPRIYGENEKTTT